MSLKQKSVEDDGFYMDSIGKWSTEKHDLIKTYAEIFSTGMKYKWDCRVYIDLFSGSGYAKTDETSEIVYTSPLLALNIDYKFDKYIFCEIKREKINSLRERIKRDFSEIDVKYIEGDVNNSTKRILEEIPKYSKDFKVISFCVVDPYSLSNLLFRTIEKISEVIVDFFVLIPSYMDANRNIDKYIHEKNRNVDRFLGYENWRDDWKLFREEKGHKFGLFVMKKFCDQMEMLGYIKTEPEDVIFVREGKRRLPLYHLALFSRHELGIDFWRKAIKSSEKQYSLDI